MFRNTSLSNNLSFVGANISREYVSWFAHTGKHDKTLTENCVRNNILLLSLRS